MTRLSILALLIALVFGASAQADFQLMIVKSGSISPAKSYGFNWDILPVWAPEPYVRVYVYDGRTGEQVDYGETPYARGSYEPVWNKAIANVAAGDSIKLEVWDKDLRYDDLIGRYEFTMTRSMINARYVILQFGQVNELRLELKPSP